MGSTFQSPALVDLGVVPVQYTVYSCWINAISLCPGCAVSGEARYSGQCVTVQLYNRDFCKRLTRAHRCSSDLACVLKSLSCSWAPVHGIQHNVTAQPHPQGLSRCVARPTSYLLHCTHRLHQPSTNTFCQSVSSRARSPHAGRCLRVDVCVGVSFLANVQQPKHVDRCQPWAMGQAWVRQSTAVHLHGDR